jgi:putative tryptophan/tyrosine transport system substrate-binding protein
MRRREFISGVLAAAGASALRAAEPNRVYRLAFSVPKGGSMSFLIDHLKQRGYTEGTNLIVDRYALEDNVDYADVARRVAQSKPDVVAFALNHRLISDVAEAVYPTPVVAVLPSLAAGLVHNIARPEGNITGVTLDAGIEMQGKQLDLLRQAVPSISRVAYLSNVEDWHGAWGHAIVDASRASEISIIGATVERSAGEREYRNAFETMVQQSAQGLVFNGLPPNFNNRALIADLALEHKLPSICWTIDIIEKGHGLMSYAPDYSLVPDQWADIIDKVFKGAKVADIPVTQPTNFILAVNLQTAKSLGLQMPAALMAQADKVIE